MKKIDDSRLYYYFGLATLGISIFLGSISFYSILVIESDINRLLSSKENISDNFRKAYLHLRKPQLFAGYEHFDSEQDLHLNLARTLKLNLESKKAVNEIIANTYPGTTILKAIRYFDKKIYTKQVLLPDEKRYLEIIFDRRKKGSRLGRNTMIFTLALSVFSWILFFYEKRSMASLKADRTDP